MGIDNAFRVARGAARVAHRGGTVFVDLVPFSRLSICQQVLVVQKFVTGEIIGNVACTVVHQHEVSHPFKRGQQRSEQTEKGTIDEDHFVIGMVDDVGELFGKQPNVQGVQHPSRARRSEIQLKVPCRIPCKGRHAAL